MKPVDESGGWSLPGRPAAVFYLFGYFQPCKPQNVCFGDSSLLDSFCLRQRCAFCLFPLFSRTDDLLEQFENEWVPRLAASNPHDLMRIHEVLDILTVSKIVLHASLERKSSFQPLFFHRSDYPEMDPAQDRKHIVIRLEDGEVKERHVPLDYFGKLQKSRHMFILGKNECMSALWVLVKLFRIMGGAFGKDSSKRKIRGEKNV